jgi:curved DNA-binding protein CbpA
VGHYEELEVSPSATPGEIRRSYLALARRFHPDHLSDVPQQERDRAAARMARINAAWSVLSDESRRAAYDVARGHDRGTGATIRDVGTSWVAYDTDDDDIDPRLLDDTPTGAPTLGRGLTFLPAGLAVAGAAAALVGFLISLFELLAVGLLLLVAAGLAFLVIPLIALANSSRADKDR